MNNRKTGMALSYINTFLSTLCGLFLSSFLLRSLGDYEYGLYQTISAFVSYLVVLEFGTGSAMCRNVLLARGSDDPDELKKATATVFYVSVFLAGIITLVGVGFGFSIPHIYAHTIEADRMPYAIKMFAVMLIYLICSFGTQTLSGVFIAYENYNVGSMVQLIKTVSRTALLTALITAFRYSIIIAIADAGISICIALFTFVYCRKKYRICLAPKYFDRQMLKTTLPLCVAMFLQVLINQANNSVDKFVISIKMNMESVSLYSVAMYIYTMFSSIVTIPIGMYMPAVAKDIKKGQKGQALTETLVQPCRLVAIIGGTILFGFIAVGRQFIRVVYGDTYSLAFIVALIALVPMFINMTTGPIINVLDVLNKRQIRSYLLMISTAVNIVLTVWLVQVWGIVGAVIATAVGLVIGQIIMLSIYYYKAFSINTVYIYLKSYRGVIPVQAAASITGYLTAAFIPNDILAFLCGGFVFVAVEVAGMYLFGATPAEKAMATAFIHKIKKKF